jgi:hypothetical protein
LKIIIVFLGPRPCSVVYDEIQEAGQKLINPEVQQTTSEVECQVRDVTEGVSKAGTSGAVAEYADVLNATEEKHVDEYHYIYVDGKKV